jgi:asparagine synthase (glutamine-hydrolysing)
VLEHHAVEPTFEGLLRDLDALVRFQEEPFGSSSIYAQWCVMRDARERGITVLLDGQGADELFGGYPGSNGWALRSEGFAGVARGILSSRDRRDVVLAIGADWAPRAAVRRHRRRSASPYAAAELRAASVGAVTRDSSREGFSSPLARELLRQTFKTSMPALLRYADRNSMAHSREVRLPYLDRRVAEFALSLPPRFLYRQGRTKAVLREAVRDLVPDVVLDRRDKIGYETPQAQWLSEPRFIERIREILLDADARSRGFYDTVSIEADAHAGRWRDPNGIWRALNLELWLRELQPHRSGCS